MKLRAAAYIRVSTEDQREYSPEAQRKALESYADSNNMLLMSRYIYVDEGISGRKAEKRPAFMKMISDAGNRVFDVILVHKFDRFARNREDSVIYKSLLKKKYGIRVISITESIDDSRISLIVEPILEALAEYYSVNLSQEVKKGMTEKALRGEYQTAPPFGYRLENGQLKINNEESRYIKYIFEAYVNGTPKKQIAAHLNSLNIKTHRGNPFETRAIDFILNNPVYIGFTRWTPTGNSVSKRDFSNPNTIIQQGSHKPIITEELFKRAHLKISNKKAGERPVKEYGHYLSGIIKCDACDSSLCYTGKSDGFQCSGYSHGLCGISHYISAKSVEAALKNELDEILFSDISPYVKVQKNSSDKAHLISQVNTLNKKLVRLKEGYLEGIFTKEEYKMHSDKIQNSLLQINNELKTNISNNSHERIVPKDIFFKNLTTIEKNNALKSILKKIIYEKASHTLHFYYFLQ